MENNDFELSEKSTAKEIKDFLLSLCQIIDVTEKVKKEFLGEKAELFYIFFNTISNSYFALSKESATYNYFSNDFKKTWRQYPTRDDDIKSYKALKLQSDMLDGTLFKKMLSEDKKNNIKKHL